MHSFTPKFDGIAQERQTVGALCVSCVVANAVNLISFYLAIVYLNCRQCIRKMLIKRCANYKFVAPIFDAWCSQLACPLKWIQAEWKKKYLKQRLLNHNRRRWLFRAEIPIFSEEKAKLANFGRWLAYQISAYRLTSDKWLIHGFLCDWRRHRFSWSKYRFFVSNRIQRLYCVIDWIYNRLGITVQFEQTLDDAVWLLSASKRTKMYRIRCIE